MQEFVASGLITEKKGFQSVSYILNDEKLFVLSGYKIMNSLENKGLLHCTKILQNGKPKLVYATGERRSMDEVCRFMHHNELVTVLIKLFDTILAVETNGFLKISNLDFNLDHVFLDAEDCTPRLIYFPLATASGDGIASEQLRNNLLQLIRSASALSQPQRDELCRYIQDRSLSFGQLKGILSSKTSGVLPNASHVFQDAKALGTSMLTQRIKLISQVAGHKNLDITSAEYVIGKNTGAVDGVVASVAVSRRHCIITHNSGKYYIEDLDSTNGTKLNGVRIPSHKKIQIKPGDLVKIADVGFKVTI